MENSVRCIEAPGEPIWLSLSQWATETELTPKSEQEWARTSFREQEIEEKALEGQLLVEARKDRWLEQE